MSKRSIKPPILRRAVSRSSWPAQLLALFVVVVTLVSVLFLQAGFCQDIAGINVTPHSQSSVMRWRRPPSPGLAARVELFLHNGSSVPIHLRKSDPLLFDNKSPQELVDLSLWAWHDSPQSWLQEGVELPPDCLTVVAFNGQSATWAAGTQHTVQFVEEGTKQVLALDAPTTWLSAVTFLAIETDGHPTGAVYPHQIVVHVQHTGANSTKFKSFRLWLSDGGKDPHVFRLAHELDQLTCFPIDATLHGDSRGGFVVNCDPLPRSYAVVEVQMASGDDEVESLWGFLKIKPEVFDISGGWIASDINGRNSLTIDEYLKTLSRMHVNTGQIEEVPGYTDNEERYSRFPLKRFNRMQDLSRYDTEELLPTIHAVEFIGEPQYGGGRPIPPQQVWKLLAPYQASRLPTSVTLSDERTWRHYAGLSDYPHYDAYRVIAPAADSWTNYDRWDGERIRWGAPLETIGDMTRSLRELSRPRPIAYWSQGAHDGWGSLFSSRRRSPTPDELRAQAWHGLSNRITSLYWFNLSLKSLVKFPDLIEPISRVNREIRLVDEILLAGDAFEHRRIEKDGKPDWEINSVVAPNAALLVIHDVGYRPDLDDKTFHFQTRRAELQFNLPSWLSDTVNVFALDADGVHDVEHAIHDGKVTIRDDVHVAGIYVIAQASELRSRIADEHAALIRHERELGFDPANDEADLARLRSTLNSNPSTDQAK
ncbi:hypothetical protein SH139x_001021 [Planctomycetaceae bacterium SH139]